MNVMAIDIGGTHVKILATGQKERREFESGPKLTPQLMVAGVKKLAKDWKYDVVSIGYPGPVLRNRPLAEPHNLAKGWVGFKFETAFKHPVKVVNDAAMQALGSYKGGKMLFLGLGTGLGTTLIVDGTIEPDDVVLGGGNVKKLKELPKGCHEGDNANAFLGGFRLWQKAGNQSRATGTKTRKAKKRRNRRLKVVAAPKSPAIAKAS